MKHKRFLILLLFSAFLTVSTMVTVSSVVLARRSSAHGTWWRTTTWCGSGACVPVPSTTKASADVYWYPRHHQNTRVVYFQRFGGTVYPKYTACGHMSWNRRSTYYQTNSGRKRISGWRSEATLCTPYITCKSYKSSRHYRLRGSNSYGVFRMLTGYTPRCFPAAHGHHVTVRFR